MIGPNLSKFGNGWHSDSCRLRFPDLDSTSILDMQDTTEGSIHSNGSFTEHLSKVSDPASIQTPFGICTSCGRRRLVPLVDATNPEIFTSDEPGAFLFNYALGRSILYNMQPLFPSRALSGLPSCFSACSNLPFVKLVFHIQILLYISWHCTEGSHRSKSAPSSVKN